MRIAVSGTASTGKSTFIGDFIKNWNNYSCPTYDYRSKLSQLPHSKSCNQDTQWTILNSMLDELQKHTVDDYVIYDRCPLDNLVYSLWSNAQTNSSIDDEFVQKCIPIVRESLRMLDIIFFVPLTSVSPVPIVDNGTRDTDPNYITEIDNIFKALHYEYQHNIDKTLFFPKEDSPGIIEIFGKRPERIYLAQQYLNTKGDVIGSEHDTILNPNNIEHLQDLLKKQTDILKDEVEEKAAIEKVKKQVIPNYINGGKKRRRN